MKHKEQKVSIYPNPTSDGVFHMEERTSWSVINSLGNYIAEGNSKTIDLTNQSEGVYFLKCNGSVHKIIKQ